ncbi:MAG: hypothetical protein NC184_04030 [Roseburia sp.]|nr:hypothetical protein [Roseburia sp.]
MRNRNKKSIAVLAAFSFAFCALGACAKATPDVSGPVVPPSPPSPGGTLAKVDKDSVDIDETSTSFVISWDAVAGAQSYVLSFDSADITATSCTVDLLSAQYDFTFPLDSELVFSIVAKASGYQDSEPVIITYTLEGEQLQSPRIISFDNGVLTWEADSKTTAHLIKINGTAVTDTGDGYWHSTSLDTKSYPGSVRVEITSIGNGYPIRPSAPTAVRTNAAKTKLAMAAVSTCVVRDNLLKWNAVNGASAYRLVDINHTVINVTGTSYDLSDKNIILGVYPVSGDAMYEDADLTETASVPYLSGKGTVEEPYLIRTPMDLRAIDYYEALYAESVGAAGVSPNNYRIESDINYDSVSAPDDESNLYTLTRPFYGVLDGNGKTLSNIRIEYDGGYWALFDFVTRGATVKNIVFDTISIHNAQQDNSHPLNSSIATVADRNYGTVTQITLKNANFSARGGEVCGIVTHNYGTVSGCTVSGSFSLDSTSALGSATYEMAGVVLENCTGGKVTGNLVKTLSLRGTGGNLCTAGGVVSVNRQGGIVQDNSYENVSVTNMVASGSEYGGVVAYSVLSGNVIKGTGSLGTFTVGGTPVQTDSGVSPYYRGKLLGKAG